jgi:hypothetical protein
MADTYKMLRGKQALTVVRGTPGRHVYRNEIVDPRSVYADDVERLVAEGFLEWVLRDGDNYTLVEDGDSGEAGDSVTVGTTSADVSPAAQQSQGADPADPGLTNSPEPRDVPADTAAKEVAEKRAEAKAKLADNGGTPDGRSSQAVWAEYLVSRGSRYEDVQGVDKAELQKLAKQQS